MLPSEFGSNPRPAPSQPDQHPSLSQLRQLRQLRRTISNRESARRSRMRKQRRLEGLRCHISTLTVLNRELANRVEMVSIRNVIIRSENERLMSESKILMDRLLDIRRILVFRQLQRLCLPVTVAVCGGFGSENEQKLASIIA